MAARTATSSTDGPGTRGSDEPLEPVRHPARRDDEVEGRVGKRAPRNVLDRNRAQELAVEILRVDQKPEMRSEAESGAEISRKRRGRLEMQRRRLAAAVGVLELGVGRE